MRNDVRVLLTSNKTHRQNLSVAHAWHSVAQSFCWLVWLMRNDVRVLLCMYGPNGAQYFFLTPNPDVFSQTKGDVQKVARGIAFQPRRRLYVAR